MDNHADRPEFKEALAGGVGTGRAPQRHARRGHDVRGGAARDRTASVAAVVRTAMPLTAVDDALSRLYSQHLHRRRRRRPRRRASRAGSSRGASPARCARCARAPSASPPATSAASCSCPRTVEFAAVAESLNRMAAELDEKLRTLTRERNEREAVLASMVEGVLAVDPDGARHHAQRRGRAAARRRPRTTPSGTAIQEVVRNPELQRVVAAALAGAAAGGGGPDVRRRRRGPAPAGQRLAAARREDDGGRRRRRRRSTTSRACKRLEAVRRDFVANVSHELKTPVTSIKGFAETLLDGAMDDPEAGAALPAHHRRAGRPPELDHRGPARALQRWSAASRAAAWRSQEARRLPTCSRSPSRSAPRRPRRKRIAVTVDCRGELFAADQPAAARAGRRQPRRQRDQVQPRGQPRSTVSAGADRRRDRDHASPTRAPASRASTCRGSSSASTASTRRAAATSAAPASASSIVKHIAQVHGGRVSVESVVGRGSTFRIHLPRALSPSRQPRGSAATSRRAL